jgi:hypothetical protein
VSSWGRRTRDDRTVGRQTSAASYQCCRLPRRRSGGDSPHMEARVTNESRLGLRCASVRSVGNGATVSLCVASSRTSSIGTRDSDTRASVRACRHRERFEFGRQDTSTARGNEYRATIGASDQGKKLYRRVIERTFERPPDGERAIVARQLTVKPAILPVTFARVFVRERRGRRCISQMEREAVIYIARCFQTDESR